MPLLIMDRGVHIDPDAVRKAFPQETVRDARDAAEALGVCADCEVLVAMEAVIDRQIVTPGERIAQLVVMPLSHPLVEIVSELDDTERGEGGFGSSDKS